MENSLRVLDRLCPLASREQDETFSPCFGYSLHSESRPIGTFQTVSLSTRVKEVPNAAGFENEYRCGKNIVARTYNHGGILMATTANIDRTARTARELAEAQRDSY